MKTTYATVAYIILRLDPTSSAQLRPRGLAATNTQAAEPDSEWSESSRAMSLATTTSLNFIEANDKGAKVRAQGLFAKAGRITKGGNICPASEGPCADVCLEALAEGDCPADTDHVSDTCYNETAIGGFCEGYGECGTNSTLDNCRNHHDDDYYYYSRRGIYRRIECESGKSGKSGKASGNPGGNPVATCTNVCLQALADNSENCPRTNPGFRNCYSEETDIGEYCDGDGECGTDDNLDNCSGNDDDYGDSGNDIYLRVNCDCLIVN